MPGKEKRLLYSNMKVDLESSVYLVKMGVFSPSSEEWIGREYHPRRGRESGGVLRASFPKLSSSLTSL